MGNELSTENERKPSLKKSHENGSVHGVSADITQNGLEVEVKGDTHVKQNGGPPSLDIPTEAIDGLLAAKTDSEPAPVAAPDLSNILETATTAGGDVLETAAKAGGDVLEAVNSKKDEVLETVNSTKDGVLETVNSTKDGVLETVNSTKDGVLDVVNQKKDEAVETVNEKKDQVLDIVNQKTDEVLETVKEKKKTSLFGKMFKKKTEPPPPVVPAEEDKSVKEEAPEESPPATDQEPDSCRQGATNKIIADLRRFLHLKETSTQTNSKTEAHIWTQTGLDDDTVLIESAATEESSLSESVVVIGEEVVGLTANAGPSLPGFIIKEVVIMEDSVYENIAFEVEQVELTADAKMGKRKETPFAATSSLSTTVPHYTETGFTSRSELTYSAAVDIPNPAVSKDNSKLAEDITVTHDAKEVNCVSATEEEETTLEMEPILEAAIQRPNPAFEKQLKLKGLLFSQVKVGSTYEDIAADYEVISLGDELETHEQEKLNSAGHDASSYNRLITIEELPEDTPGNEEEPEPVPEVEICQDVAANLEPSPAIFIDNAEVVELAAIDTLALDFAQITITPQEPGEYGILVEEQVIVATTYIPLTEDQEAGITIPDEQCEAVAVGIQEESLITGIKTMSESVEENTTVQIECFGITKLVQNISVGPPGESPSSCEDDTVKKEMENAPEVVIQTMLKRLEIVENLAEEPTEVLVQEELEEKTNTPMQKLPKDTETAGPSLLTMSTEHNLHRQRTKTDGLVATFEKKVESVFEAFSEKFHVIENTFEVSTHKQEDLQLTPAAEDYEPRISVQQGLEENFTVAQVHLEEDGQESDLLLEVAEECDEETGVHEENCASFIVQQPIRAEVVVMFDNKMEAVVEAVSGKLKLTGDVVQEHGHDPLNVPQVDETEECEPCVSVQERLTEENMTTVEMFVQDASGESVENVKYLQETVEEHVEDSTGLFKQHTEAEKTEDVLEMFSKANVPQMGIKGKFQLCASVAGKLRGGYLVGESNKEHASTPECAPKCIETQIHVTTAKPVVDVAYFPEPLPNSEVHVVQSDQPEQVCEAEILQSVEAETEISPADREEFVRPTESKPVIFKELVKEGTSLPRQHTEAEMLEDTLETVDKAFSAKFQGTRNISLHSKVSASHMETTMKAKFCGPVAGRLEKEYRTAVGHLIEEPNKEHAHAPSVGLKCSITQIRAIPEMPVVDFTSFPEPLSKSDVVVEQSNQPEQVFEAEILQSVTADTKISPVVGEEYARPTESKPVIPLSLVEDGTDLSKQHTEAEMLKDTPETVDKAFSAKFQGTGNKTHHSKVSLSHMVTTMKAKLGHLIGEPNKDHSFTPLVAPKCSETQIPVIAETSVEDVACFLEPLPKSDVLVVQSNHPEQVFEAEILQSVEADISPVVGEEYVGPNESNAVVFKELLEGSTSLPKQHTEAEMSEDTMEPVDKAFSAKFQGTGNLHSKVSVSHMETTTKAKICGPTAVRLEKENRTAVGHLIGEPHKEHVKPPLVGLKHTEIHIPVFAEKPVVDVACFSVPLPKTGVLMVQANQPEQVYEAGILRRVEAETEISPVDREEYVRPTESNAVIFKELVEEVTSLPKQHTEAEKTEGVMEMFSKANVPQMGIKGKFRLCASVAGKFGGGYLVGEPNKEHAHPPVLGLKCPETQIHVTTAKPVVNVAYFPEPLPKSEVHVVQANQPELVIETVSEPMKVTEMAVSEPVDQVHLPCLNTNEKSVQESIIQVNVAPKVIRQNVEVETVIPPVDAVEYVDPSESNHSFFKDLAEDGTQLLKQHKEVEMLEDTLEKVDKAFSAKLQGTRNVNLDYKVHAQQMKTTPEANLCGSVKGRLGRTYIPQVRVNFEDAGNNNPFTAEEPVVDVACLSEPLPGTEVLVVQSDNLPESVVEVYPGHLVKEQVDVQVHLPQLDAKGEFEHCSLTQASLHLENVPRVQALLKDACEETDLQSFKCSELTDLNPVIPEESAEESSSFLEQHTATAEDVSVKYEAVGNVLKQINVPWVSFIKKPEPRVSIQEEIIEELVTPDEVQLEDVLGQMVAPSLVLPSVSANETVTFLEQEPQTKGFCIKMGNNQESTVGIISRKFDVTEKIMEKQADVPMMEASGELKSWVSLRKDLVEENMSHHEEQAQTEGLMENLETTEGDSQLASSNGVLSVNAVCDNIVEEIVTEQVEAGRNLVILEEVEGQEINSGQIRESSMEMIEASSASSSAMDDLVLRLQSACTSIVNESTYDLSGLEISRETTKVEEEPQPEPSPPPEPVPEPESVTPEEEKAPETEPENKEPEEQEEIIPEENLVMNFFKTLVTPTKTTKKDTAAPAAAKDQSPEESQPDTTTTVAQVSEPPAAPKGMSIPPPPPPEPPKMEIKAEPAKASPKPEPKAAAKEPEPKSAKNALSSFFRSKVRIGLKASKGKGAASGAKASAKPAAGTSKKTPEPEPEVEVEAEPVVEAEETPAEVPEPAEGVQSEIVDLLETAVEAAQPVVEMVENAEEQAEVEDEKVDPSKVVTLEAAAKPEPPPPAQEEKKADTKAAFLSLFKPKVLLDNMTTKVQAASTSGVRFLRRTAGVASGSKKATPAPAASAAAGEAAQTAKAKEEPKAAAAKPSEAAPENKPASAAAQAGDEAANVPKKLEKRNSIHTFFKSLGQRRGSTDAGVQTEPAVPAAAEKAK